MQRSRRIISRELDDQETVEERAARAASRNFRGHRVDRAIEDQSIVLPTVLRNWLLGQYLVPGRSAEGFDATTQLDGELVQLPDTVTASDLVFAHYAELRETTDPFGADAAVQWAQVMNSIQQ